MRKKRGLTTSWASSSLGTSPIELNTGMSIAMVKGQRHRLESQTIAHSRARGLPR